LAPQCLGECPSVLPLLLTLHSPIQSLQPALSSLRSPRYRVGVDRGVPTRTGAEACLAFLARTVGGDIS
jgi:hypothetical protein